MRGRGRFGPGATVLVLAAASTGALHGAQRADPGWPQLLGPDRNAIASGSRLAPSWPTSGPDRLWRREVGAGFAGPAVAGERLILFHRVGDVALVEALSTADGTTLWSTPYPTAYRDDFGFDDGPRATPTVADGRVFTLGAEGVLQALDLQTGARLWAVDTREAFEFDKGFFGEACSPLVLGARVMINVGGKGAGIVAFDVATGVVAWTATDDEAGYASPVPATFGGRQHVLFFTREGLVDVDPDDGRVLDEVPWRSRSRASVNAASPLVIGRQVFLSASYGTGAVLLDRGDDGYQPRWSSDESLSSHYATSVHHDGVLYGFHGALHLGPPDFRAVELATGRVLWRQARFGGGTVLGVGDDLLVTRDDGRVVVTPASATGFSPRLNAEILAPTVRAYPALVGGVLYARNTRELVAVRVGSAAVDNDGRD